MIATNRVLLLDLIDAAARATALMDRSMARIGIGSEELRVLSAIGAGGPDGTSIGSAATALSVSSSTTLRRIRPLEKLGWIEKRGSMSFALTDSGRAIAREGRDICSDATLRMQEGCLSGAEQDVLAGLLTKISPKNR